MSMDLRDLMEIDTNLRTQAVTKEWAEDKETDLALDLDRTRLPTVADIVLPEEGPLSYRTKIVVESHVTHLRRVAQSLSVV